MRPAIARTEKLSKELLAAGLDRYRIEFPKGMMRRVRVEGPAGRESLGLVIRQAQWLVRALRAASSRSRSTRRHAGEPLPFSG